MKIFFLGLFLLGIHSTGHAKSPQPASWDRPEAVFNATNTITNQTLVTWRRVSNVMEECNAESTRLSVAKIKPPFIACSFWTKKTCLIITNKNTTQHSLGHELRHCFQGDWH